MTGRKEMIYCVTEIYVGWGNKGRDPKDNNSHIPELCNPKVANYVLFGIITCFPDSCTEIWLFGFYCLFCFLLVWEFGRDAVDKIRDFKIHPMGFTNI